MSGTMSHDFAAFRKAILKENMFNALSKLDQDGVGSFKIQDVMRVMEEEDQQMPQARRLQRYHEQRYARVVTGGME